MDFWISEWISADGVRDFFCDGPLVPVVWPRVIVKFVSRPMHPKFASPLMGGGADLADLATAGPIS